MLDFYSIIKQGTKVLFFWGGEGGGEDKDRVLRGIKTKLVETENIGKLVGRRGDKPIYFMRTWNRLPAY